MVNEGTDSLIRMPHNPNTLPGNLFYHFLFDSVIACFIIRTHFNARQVVRMNEVWLYCTKRGECPTSLRYYWRRIIYVTKDQLVCLESIIQTPAVTKAVHDGTMLPGIDMVILLRDGTILALPLYPATDNGSAKHHMDTAITCHTPQRCPRAFINYDIWCRSICWLPLCNYLVKNRRSGIPSER